MFTVKRSPYNPILKPIRELSGEAFAIFNWCPVKEKKIIHCLFRETAETILASGIRLNFSTIGYAQSKDGIHFKERKKFIVPEFEWEKFGCEDPRVTKLGEKYYVFYTALSEYPFTARGIKVGLAITKDFKTIEEKQLVTPFNAKAMALFPDKIKGKLVVILTVNPDMPPSRIAIAQFEKEEEIYSSDYWNNWYKELDKNTIKLRRADSDHVEIGAPPIKTEDGWLLIYSHIQYYFTDNKIFGIEAVLLDLEEPRNILGRTRGPFLVPEEIYEKFGYVPNVVFPSGGFVEGGKLQIYYGAADTSCCVAMVNLDDLLNYLKSEVKGKRIRRYEKNPIITPNPNNRWEAKATFNPAVIDLGGKIHILYRALSTNNTSVIGYAATVDGFNINERLTKPVYVPREAFEMKTVKGAASGCEDPRITKIGNTLYMFYTAYDGTYPKVAVTTISVEDFLNKNWKWTIPFWISLEKVDDKDACLLPGRVKGKYMVFHRISVSICATFVDSLNFELEKIDGNVKIIQPRRGMWDSKKVGIAGPPIKTKEGWILLYHGISDDNVYRVGAALLDLEDPTIVLSRTASYILGPELEYEKGGIVSNVVFPCGAVVRQGILFIYYGGADLVVGVATVKIGDLLDMLL